MVSVFGSCLMMRSIYAMFALRCFHKNNFKSNTFINNALKSLRCNQFSHLPFQIGDKNGICLHCVNANTSKKRWRIRFFGKNWLKYLHTPDSVWLFFDDEMRVCLTKRHNQIEILPWVFFLNNGVAHYRSRCSS